MEFREGNLLEADVEALVNTVNTVGVMGKGIALMFKERFPENFDAYSRACKAGEVDVGKLFVTYGVELSGPEWIVNFPTKKHWRNPTKIEWLDEGLLRLREFIEENEVQSIAIPPLGCGNGGLDWTEVKPLIERRLSDLPGTRVVVFEPTQKYQNVAKKKGVEKLTPARALIAEMVRRYWVLGVECTILEIQKLAWFLERSISRLGIEDPMELEFEANRYGPFSNRLSHLLNGLDGSYLRCDKRIADASPFDTIQFADEKRDKVDLYLRGPEGREFLPAIEATQELIDGFESPLGLEVLSTVDWLVHREGVEPTVVGIRAALNDWPGGNDAGERKQRIFSDRMLTVALERVA